MLQTQAHKKTDVAQAAAAVFCLMWACSLLSFSGVPISDDEELYASAARNLAVNGALSAEQLYGNLRIAGSYHGVEPAFPALASLWIRLFLHSGAGELQALYLLPILCTALSATLIVVIAAQLGFRSAAGATAAILYGLSTMAWPYAKTLFREPFIALLLLGSLSTFLYLVREGHRPWSTVLISVLLITLLAVLTLTRVVMVVAAVALFVALPLVHPALRGRRKTIVMFVSGSLVLFLALAIFSALSRATDENTFYRFTGSFVQDALTRLKTIPHSHLLEALAAPLISPWKGLLFYSPVCMLGLIALAKNIRRPELSILPATVLMALLLGQALAYDEQWWTPTWGSRFLLPAIPLLVVASLPLLGRLMDSSRGGRLMLAGLFAIGFIIQLPAVLFNSSAFTAITYKEAAGAFPEALIWNIARTPIIAQWQMAAMQGPDLLLWRTASAQPLLVLAVCLLALCLIGPAIYLRQRLLTGEAIHGRSMLLLFGSSALGIVLACAALLRAGLHDPAYEMAEFKPLCGFITSHIGPSEILIVQPYPGPAWQYLMNAECGQRAWYSLPYNNEPTSGPGVSQIASELISREVPAGAHYWLLQQFWSESFDPTADSLAQKGDPLVQEMLFHAPIHMFIGSYERR